MKTWPIFSFVGLLLAGLTIVFFLGKEVESDLKALSTAKTDDISFLMAQLEVELLRLEVAVLDASHSAQSDLSAVRNRFDIFYSRADTLQNSALFTFLRDDPDAQPALNAVEAFFSDVTGYIDASDLLLRSNLAEVRAEIQQLRPVVRTLALDGIQGFAHENAMRRVELAGTLKRLATLLVVLFVALFLAFAFLIRLFQQGQVFALQSEMARNRFEAVITSSLDAVLVADRRGRILEFNGAAEEVFGYTQSEAIGADMAELIIPAHLRGLHRKGIKRYLRTRDPKVIGTGRVRLEGMRKSKETFPVELSISVTKTDGELAFVSFLRDITEELKAEEDLRVALDKAQESEQAKSDLLTVMSHEMRTPLNGILGSVELIDQSDLTDRQKRHLNSIEVSGKLLLSHVTDVLDFSRLGSGTVLRDTSVFNVSRLVTEVCDSLSANADARNNTSQVTFLSGDLDEVVGYQTTVQQCLVNLLGNAIEFTREGEVNIEVERLGNGDLVEFRVSDTGVGIEPEYLEVIFDAFVTIDTAYAREKSGTGLGLAITKGLIEAMGGEITADSIPGEGSLFTMRLPLPKARNAQTTGLVPQGRSDVGLPKGLCALVVDDNEINRMILSDMLNDLGIEVVEAPSGYAAIEQLSARAFDILLLDISMPGIDGIQTLARIRELDVPWRGLPVLAVTAHASPQDHEVIQRSTFQGVLIKPVPFEQLSAEMVRFLSSHNTVSPSKELPEASGNDFRQRFGEEKYRLAMTELSQDLEDLISCLQGAEVLDVPLKQRVHKLTGSAAILGQQALWEQLRKIEDTAPDAWMMDRALHMDRLKGLAKGALS